MKTFYPIAFVLCLCLAISSCKKETDENTLSAEDNAAVETEFSQVYDVAADFLANDTKTGKQENFLLPEGVMITFSDSIFSDSDGVACIIDYGALEHGASYKGIPCRDGRYRAGKIHAAINHRFSQAVSSLYLTITAADEYFVGNGTKMYKLTGLKTVNRTSDTAFTETVENATMQRENGSLTWNCERTISFLPSNGSSWWDKEYEVTGTANGTNKNGESFSTETTTPLHKKLELGCLSTYVSGKIKLTNANGKELNIDYGNGECDKKIAVSVNGKTKSIEVW